MELSFAQGLKRSQRTRLVSLHEAAVANNIGSSDHYKPTLHSPSHAT